MKEGVGITGSVEEDTLPGVAVGDGDWFLDSDDLSVAGLGSDHRGRVEVVEMEIKAFQFVLECWWEVIEGRVVLEETGVESLGDTDESVVDVFVIQVDIVTLSFLI